MKKHNPRPRPQKVRKHKSTNGLSLRQMADALRRTYNDGEERYYHGGVPGLQPGDFILPASETGTLATTDQYIKAGAIGRAIREGTVYDRGRVYVVDKIDLAIIHAGRYRTGCGDVYEVEPIGEACFDPDSPPDCISIICERARIVRCIPIDPRILQRIKGMQIQAAAHAGRLQLT